MRFFLLLAIWCATLPSLAQDTITIKDLQHASHIFGMTFTPAELDSLHDDALDQLRDYQRNRELPLDNSVAPALHFNPHPQGFVVPTGPSALNLQQAPVKLPANMNDLAFYTVSELAHLIQTRQISSVRLTEFFLQRLRLHDPTLHCVITYTEERAMRHARQMDRELAEGKYRGFLHGIPYGIKDLFATEDYRTTWGAAPFKDQVIDMDATVVTRLEEAGAVLVAKLTLGALAWGDVWYGERTRNPWDPERGSSGSSAGSASAVAAGLVPFAIGTETLGSIVSPSTVCGTTGLRPTYGRVSRHGAMALSWSMDKIGPICRSAQDCAIVFDAIRGPDGKDLSVTDAPFNYSSRADLSGLRIGYVKSHFDRPYAFHDQDSAALEVMRSMGIDLIEVELPPYPDIRFLLSAEAAAAFDQLTRSNKDDLMVRQIRNAWPNVFRAARFIPAVEYIQANRLRSILIEQMDDLFDDVDIIIHPSWRSSALSITNMTGHPAVVMPNGFREGRPTSIT
ncbi:MAG: amidase, partial [Saprospiraceae bacterium]|nr:amidase [Saprospiraceae bacterium]